jgi:hypothetical protein
LHSALPQRLDHTLRRDEVKVAALCSGDGYGFVPANENCEAALLADPFGDLIGNPRGTPRTGIRLLESAKKAIEAAKKAGIKPEKTGRVLIQSTNAAPPKQGGRQ